MTKEDVIGQIVLLDEEFIESAHDFVDENVPVKSARPYLVVELKWKSKSPLFAIPIQTSVSKSMPDDFFEKLPRRLDTRAKCECGLLFGQMVPITADLVLEKKGADTCVPRDEEKQDIIFENLCMSSGNNIPEKAQASFTYLKKQARKFGMSIFEDKQFRHSYKIVANQIFQNTTNIVNEKIVKITQKAQNYFEKHYMVFLTEKVYKKNKNCNVVMPMKFTRIDKILKFMKERRNAANNKTVKTSLQNNPIADKYSLTKEKFDSCKRYADRNNLPLEQVIRSNIAFAPDSHYDSLIKSNVITEEAAKRKQQNKTQEKNTSKPVAVKTKKSNQDQNSR